MIQAFLYTHVKSFIYTFITAVLINFIMATTIFIIPFLFLTDDERVCLSRRGLRGGCPPARMPARPLRLEPFFSPPGRAGWGAGEKTVAPRLLRGLLPPAPPSNPHAVAPLGQPLKGESGCAPAARDGVFRRFYGCSWLLPPAHTFFVGYRQHHRALAVRGGSRRGNYLGGGSPLPAFYVVVTSRRCVGYSCFGLAPPLSSSRRLCLVTSLGGHPSAGWQACGGPAFIRLPPAKALFGGTIPLSARRSHKKTDKRLNVIASDNNVYRFFVD